MSTVNSLIHLVIFIYYCYSGRHDSTMMKKLMFCGLLLQNLYQLGARIFWIHNTGPIGCLPYSVIYYPPKPANKDQNGCVKSHNEIAQEFNRQLKDKVSQLRKQLPDAVLTYTDIYTAKYSLISEAKKQGKLQFYVNCFYFIDYKLPFKFIFISLSLNTSVLVLQGFLIHLDIVVDIMGITVFHVGERQW